VRPDTAGCVSFGGDDEHALRWTADTAVRYRRSPTSSVLQQLIGEQHRQGTRRAAAPAKALHAVLLDACCEWRHAIRSPGASRIPACLLSLQECRLEKQPAVCAQGANRRRAGEAANLLRDGSGQRHGGNGGTGNAQRVSRSGVQLADRTGTRRVHVRRSEYPSAPTCQNC